MKKTAGFFIDELTEDFIMASSPDKTMIVNRTAFEAWANYNDLRDFENNTSDHTGDHVQVSGKLTWDEYYQTNDSAKDIYNYLETHTVSGKLKDLPDLGAAFTKLLNQITF